MNDPSVLDADHGERRDLLDCAEAFARHAGDITLRYFGGKLRADIKADGTPVTDADREAESALRDDILARFPEHGVVGEEFGITNPEARIRWIVDPIDGTKSFVRGVPLYGVLIGVEVDSQPVVGVAHFPALCETVVAAAGLGCRWQAQAAQVSTVGTLDEAALLTTDLKNSLSHPNSSGFAALTQRCAFTRTWGDCYGHILVATGRAEIMVDPELSLWDAGPLLTIVTEAGGRFTSVGGDASIDGGSGVSTNGLLHAETLRILAGG